MCFQEALAKLHLSLAALGLPVERLLPAECGGFQTVDVPDLGGGAAPKGRSQMEISLHSWSPYSTRICAPSLMESSPNSPPRKAQEAGSESSCPPPGPQPERLSWDLSPGLLYSTLRGANTGQRAILPKHKPPRGGSPLSGKVARGSDMMPNGLSTWDQIFSVPLWRGTIDMCW